MCLFGAIKNNCRIPFQSRKKKRDKSFYCFFEAKAQMQIMYCSSPIQESAGEGQVRIDCACSVLNGRKVVIVSFIKYQYIYFVVPGYNHCTFTDVIPVRAVIIQQHFLVAYI